MGSSFAHHVNEKNIIELSAPPLPSLGLISDLKSCLEVDQGCK